MTAVTTGLHAGDLNFNGPLQKEELAPIILATNVGGGEGGITITLRMRVPSARIRSKLSVFFEVTPGVAFLPIVGPSIWVSACEMDQKGIGGGGGGLFPVTDLEGTQAIPKAFPESSGLAGYAREFVTAAPWIQAVVFLESIAAAGVWVAQASCEPAFTSFATWDEWQEVRRLFSLNSDLRGTL